MKIIELNELQFRNYSNLSTRKNYKQSVEYAKIEQKNGYGINYLALLDENDNVLAACLLLDKKLSGKYRYGYCPNGFLIDYFNLSLLTVFVKELKKYLKSRNYIYVRVNPYFEYQVFSSNYVPIENNSRIINELKKLGFVFIHNTSVNNVILKTNDINKTYSNFKRSLKRNIKSALERSITVHRCGEDEYNIFYDMIDNKIYFKELINNFNNPNNMIELYYAKMDAKIYINNYRYLLKLETERNQKLSDKLQNRKTINKTRLVNKKMISDKLIIKYNNEIVRATDIYSKYPDGVVISSCAVINNRREIIFIKEGYKEEFKDIKSMPIMKWEIIKKYIKRGYNSFNLGEFKDLSNQKYKTSIGFNGNIVEINNDFDFVINDVLYKLNASINSITKKNNN